MDSPPPVLLFIFIFFIEKGAAGLTFITSQNTAHTFALYCCYNLILVRSDEILIYVHLTWKEEKKNQSTERVARRGDTKIKRSVSVVRAKKKFKLNKIKKSTFINDNFRTTTKKNYEKKRRPKPKCKKWLLIFFIISQRFQNFSSFIQSKCVFSRLRGNAAWRKKVFDRYYEWLWNVVQF